MKINEEKVTKLRISEVDNLDLINVILDDINPGRGRIMIECYGKAWTAYWGAMGKHRGVATFFCDCDNEYIAKNLQPRIKREVYCIDKLKKDAEKKGVECWRDDPWNDYGFMSDMYGGDMVDWDDLIPKKENHNYVYLCRIIDAVKEALNLKYNGWHNWSRKIAPKL